MSGSRTHDTDPDREPVDPEDHNGDTVSDRALLARVDERSMFVHQGLERLRSEMHGWRQDVGRDFVLVRARFEQLESAVRDLTRSVGEELQSLRLGGAPRRRLPSMSEFGPEETDGGGIRIGPEGWLAFQERIAQLEEALEAAERAKRISDARALGGREAVEAIEKAAEARRKKVGFWVSLAVAGGGAVGWLVTHVLHL